MLILYSVIESRLIADNLVTKNNSIDFRISKILRLCKFTQAIASRIIAPFLRESGVYVVLEHHPDIYSQRYPEYAKGLRAFPNKTENERSLYGKRAIGAWIPSDNGGRVCGCHHRGTCAL